MMSKKMRTVLTLAGITLSVSMMVSVSTFLESYMVRGRNRNQATVGQWSARVFDISWGDTSVVTEGFPNDDVFYIQDLGFSTRRGYKQQNRPYLMISAYSPTAFEKMNVELVSGRLPENDHELLIPHDLTDYFSTVPTIGQSFTISMGDRVSDNGTPIPRFAPLLVDESTSMSDTSRTIREKISVTQQQTYTIVGTMERSVTDIPNTAFFSCLTALDTAHVESSEKLNLYLSQTAPPTNYSSQLRDLSHRLPEASELEVNDDLLAYYPQFGGTNLNTFYTMSFFILGAIFISAFFLIYNSFSISSSARTAQLGLLASVGTTERQKKNTVLKEGWYVSLLGIPLGILIGLGAMDLLFRILAETQSESYERFPFVFSFTSVGLASLLAIFGILMALLLPAARASHIMPLEAIRLGDAPTPKKKMRTKQGWMRLFKIEGVLAQENIRSNRIRRRALVLSLSLSLTVFLSISYYVFSAFLGANATVEYRDADLELTFFSEAFRQGEPSELLETLRESPRIDRVTTVSSDYGYMLSARTLFDIPTLTDEVLVDVATKQQCVLHILEDDIFTRYLESLGEKPEYYIGRPIGVLAQASRSGNILQAGNRYSFLMSINEAEREASSEDMKNPAKEIYLTATSNPISEKVTVGYTTNSVPELYHRTEKDTPLFFLSRSFMDSLSDFPSPKETTVYLTARNRDHLPLENDIRDMVKIYTEDSYRLNNFARERETLSSKRTISGVLSFVFLFLIGVLAVSNSLHSLSTGLELRRREFSMLRSVGMTPSSFRKMFFFEGMYYCLFTLLIALPLSLLINSILFLRNTNTLAALFTDFGSNLSFFFQYSFMDSFVPTLPLIPYLSGIVAVFFCVFFSQFLAIREMKNHNIVEIMRERNG